MHSLNFSAIATVVTIAEILKNNGLAVERSKILDSYFHLLDYNLERIPESRLFIVNFFFENKSAEIMTSMVDVKDESRGRPMQKAKVRLARIMMTHSCA